MEKEIMSHQRGDKMKSPVGVIGLGSMGSGIARNLVKAGFEVWVYDVRPEPIQKLVAEGAHAAISPQDLGAKSTFVFTVLLNYSQIQDAVLNAGGVLAGMQPGTTLSFCSTISPAEVRSAGDAAAARGVRFLDSPMSGGVRGAQSGSLTLMIGGDPQVFEAARPVLQAVAKNLYFCGKNLGDGQTVKMINQLLVTVGFIATAEAVVLAEKSGLDLSLVHEAIKNSAGDSWVWRDKLPLIIARDFATRGALDIQIKDMNVVLETSQRLGVPLLLGALAHQVNLIAQSKGLGREDASAVVKLVEEWASLPNAVAA
jgi:3-hydroxyisobutyrate dehydrogenase